MKKENLRIHNVHVFYTCKRRAKDIFKTFITYKRHTKRCPCNVYKRIATFICGLNHWSRVCLAKFELKYHFCQLSILVRAIILFLFSNARKLHYIITFLARTNQEDFEKKNRKILVSSWFLHSMIVYVHLIYMQRNFKTGKLLWIQYPFLHAFFLKKFF